MTRSVDERRLLCRWLRFAGVASTRAGGRVVGVRPGRRPAATNICDVGSPDDDQNITNNEAFVAP